MCYMIFYVYIPIRIVLPAGITLLYIQIETEPMQMYLMLWMLQKTVLTSKPEHVCPQACHIWPLVLPLPGTMIFEKILRLPEPLLFHGHLIFKSYFIGFF